MFQDKIIFRLTASSFCSYYFGPWTLLISPQYLVKRIERNGDRFIGETSNKVEYPLWIFPTIEGWNTKIVVSASRFELSVQPSPIFVFKNPFKSRNKKRFHFNFYSNQIEFQLNDNFPFSFFLSFLFFSFCQSFDIFVSRRTPIIITNRPLMVAISIPTVSN